MRASRIKLGVAAGVFAVLVSACGGSTGGTGNSGAEGTYHAPAGDIKAALTISNWGNPGDEAVYDAAIKRFNAKYPNVTVKNNFTQVVNWTDYINKILTSVASGDAPDVINIATEGVEFGVDKKLFLPLDNYVKQDASVQKLLDDIDPHLIDGFTKGGKTTLLPNNWNAMVLYYNKLLFDAAGLQRPSDDWTWDQFLAAAQKLTKTQGANKVYGFGLQNYTFSYFPWFYSNAASIASGDLKQPTLDSPQMVESMQFLKDLVYKYAVSPKPAGTEANDLFAAGKIAMVGAPANLSSTLISGSPNFEFGIVPMPHKTTKATVFGAAGFGIYQQSKNQDLAWELIKELASQDTQASWAKLGSSNPTTRSAAESKPFQDRHPDAKYLYGAIQYAAPVAAPTYFTTLEPAFQRALATIMSGGDVQTELKKANDEVKETVSHG